ncbi:helix-turn-helix domain-containing protein [Nitrospirillum amazonense]|uniref:helix-turn-helix domain-containing protein n=1 Tax=Nitrospirillum amazonense TaxID=28077 RepID=UPI0011A2C239|nr:helix-turn-helix transcriptional regulator [Nitrospirillum amazonense]
MQPEQLRAARSALNWNLDRLAEESGIHRNTISNFENRKYSGESVTINILKNTLRMAGIIFIEESENESAGIRMRRFRVGDKVSFRPNSRVSAGISPREVGDVVEVEPHPPATGPTYQIKVKFDQKILPYIFRYEFELKQPAPDDGENIQSEMIRRPYLQIVEDNI